MTPFRRPCRPLAPLLGVAVAALAATAVPAAAVPSTGGGEDGAAWVVQAAPGALAQARSAALAAGATVVSDYPGLDALAVRGTTAELGRVLADPAVLGAREDSPVTVTQTADGDRPAPTQNVYRDAVRAGELAAAGGTGGGVTVAVIDTGISAVPQLADRLVPVTDLDGVRRQCVDFSGEQTCADTYGHGTFLAGLVAGSGAHPGMSSARLLSLKLAGASGATDTSTVLAALQWVVAHRDVHRIRVVNLSLGTPSGVSWRFDPLNYAVQRVVDAGIVVVASAGNTGPAPQSILKPGDDPHVLTVGATDDNGTADRSDDAVPLFSAQGPTRTDLVAKPDVVAPGARLISVRSPGSTIEQNVPGGVDASYRRGSGTSMATAVVSGAVAQLLSLHPQWTPAQVKQALVDTATPVDGQPRTVVGAGLVDVAAAGRWAGLPAPGPKTRSDGTGSLAGSRGALHVVDTATGAEVVAEHTAAGQAFDGERFRSTGWTRESWPLSQFAAPRWHSTNWQSTNWQSTNWQSTNWQSTNWQSTNWQSTNWQSTNWQSTNWQSTNWQSTNWQSTNWQGSTAEPTAYYGRPGHGSAVLGAWE